MVELPPLHLVAVWRPRLALAEVEAVLEIGLLVVEGSSVLDEEPVTLDAVPNTQSLEHRHHGGKERFAHVEARKGLALHQRDAEPSASEECRGGRACRAAADHDDVVVRFVPAIRAR